MAVTPEIILKEIKSKKYKPVYFLYGDEPYYIDSIASLLENQVIAPSEKDFNQFIIYGKDVDVATVLSHATRYPFMSERQLIVVKDANKLNGIDQKEMQARLEAYVKQPLMSTVLVFCFSAQADERKTFVKAFGLHGAIVQSKKMYDNKLPEWVTAYCQAEGVKVSPKAVQILVDNIGNDLKRLTNEIRKITINLQPGQGIDAEAVERYVGISKDYNVFEFQKALCNRDVFKSNKIAMHFAANLKDNPLAPILIILYGFFTKLLLTHASSDKSEKGLAVELGVNPFFVKDYLVGIRNYPLPKVVKIIQYLRDADAKMKGVEAGQIKDGDILKELVFKIIH